MKKNFSLVFDRFENAVTALLIAVIVFFFTLNCSSHPWIGTNSMVDSSVFKTVAFMIKKGYMPYRDSFDHKGPLIYLINLLGYIINANKGIWVLEYIFNCISFFCFYKISRLICNKTSSIFTCMLSTSILFECLEGGNFTEEYAMTFITLSLFFFLDYLLNEKISRSRLLICGLSFGGTILLRANMISVWIVFCIAVIIRVISKNQRKRLILFITWFFVGFGVLVIPIVIWLIVNEAFLAFWNDYFVFNLTYISSDNGIAMVVDHNKLFTTQWSIFIGLIKNIPILFSFVIILFQIKNKRDDIFINYVYLIFLIISLLFVCSSGETYKHYNIVLVPILVYPISNFMFEIEKIKGESSHVLFIIVFTLILAITPWLDFISSIPQKYDDRKLEKRTYLNVVMMIEENTTEDETISVYGNWDYIYCSTKRKHATKFSYQFPVGQIMPTIMEEYWEQLGEELPKIIVVQRGHLDYDIVRFLNDNEYECLWRENEGDISANVYIKHN